MTRTQWRHVWRFTPEHWATLGSVVRDDHMIEWETVDFLEEHGFVKDVRRCADHASYAATVTGAGLQAWEWYLLRSRKGPRLGRQWRTRTWF